MELTFEQKEKIIEIRHGVKMHLSIYKTDKEKEIFEEFRDYVYGIKRITEDVIRRYKKALATLFVLISISVNAQSSIVTAGTKDFTIGETFPIMQTITVEKKEVSLGVPKFEIPIEKPQPKPAVKKENWFIKLLKRIFNIK